MREKAVRSVLSVLERHTPPFVISFELQVLISITARAFDQKGRAVWYLPAGKALERYAKFSAECMQRVLRADLPGGDRGAGAECGRRLYRYAFAAGRRIRTLTGFTEREDLERLVFYLYRNINIVMSGSIPGEIRVSACFFSRYYTKRMCALMSNLDSGIAAGVCGRKFGSRLLFNARITEGDGRCLAVEREPAARSAAMRD